MTKRKQNTVSDWKPLKLEGSVFSGDIDGLIGIEELTDYELEKQNNKTKIVIHNEEDNNEKIKVGTNLSLYDNTYNNKLGYKEYVHIL